MKSKLFIAAALALVIIPLVTPAGMGTAKAGTRSGITLFAKDIDLCKVVQMVARQGKFNIVFGQGVKGKTTVGLRNIPPKAALRRVAGAMGFHAGPVKGAPGTWAIVKRGRKLPALRFAAGKHRGSFCLKASRLDIRKVFQMIARAGRLSIVLSPLIKETVPVELRGLPYLTSLELLARLRGYEIFIDPAIPNVYVICLPAQKKRRLAFDPPIDPAVPRDFSLKVEDLLGGRILEQIAYHGGIDLDVGRPYAFDRLSVELENLRPLEALKLVCRVVGAEVVRIPGTKKRYKAHP